MEQFNTYKINEDSYWVTGLSRLKLFNPLLVCGGNQNQWKYLLNGVYFCNVLANKLEFTM